MLKLKKQQKDESKEPNLNVGEVDLGYTDHDKEQPERRILLLKKFRKKKNHKEDSTTS